LAHSLSLSRLGAELPLDASSAEIQRQFGRRWLFASERETGRRVWHAIVSQPVLGDRMSKVNISNCIQMELSFTSASDHHFACITPLDQQLCVRPANVDDEDLEGHGPIRSQPDDVHTVSLMNPPRGVRLYSIDAESARRACPSS
jgi:hypothetical protein